MNSELRMSYRGAGKVACLDSRMGWLSGPIFSVSVENLDWDGFCIARVSLNPNNHKLDFSRLARSIGEAASCRKVRQYSQEKVAARFIDCCCQSISVAPTKQKETTGMGACWPRNDRQCLSPGLRLSFSPQDCDATSLTCVCSTDTGTYDILGNARLPVSAPSAIRCAHADVRTRLGRLASSHRNARPTHHVLYQWSHSAKYSRRRVGRPSMHARRDTGGFLVPPAGSCPVHERCSRCISS